MSEAQTAPGRRKAAPIRKRLWAIALAGGVSGLFFTPFALQARPDWPAEYVWIGFPVGGLVVSFLCAWAGLRLADRAGLAMPYLRPWELKQPGDSRERGWLVRVCVAAGGVFGLAGTVAAHLSGAPPHPGNLTVRLSAFLFVALLPEIVAHLFVMSGLLLVTKRTWLSILLSGVVFVLVFHGGRLSPVPLPPYGWVFDYLFGILTGWIYSRYGLEGAALTGAVAQAILFGIN
jgi:hypothetical protein